jgi:acyl transferase domain-containing protein
MELGCLEVLYPSAPFMADMVELWSNKELPTWERLYSAMQLEYNPIENYDRQEEWTDEKDETRESSVSDSTILDGETQNSGSVTHAIQNRTTDRKVTGYNSNTLQPQSQDIESGSTVDTDATKQEVDSTTTRTGSGSEDTTGTVEHVGRVHGNIGVTTSQQMLQSELDLVPQLNIINYIISSFKSRFCILVY